MSTIRVVYVVYSVTTSLYTNTALCMHAFSSCVLSLIQPNTKLKSIHKVMYHQLTHSPLTTATQVRYPISRHVRWSCGHQVRQVGFFRALRFPPKRRPSARMLELRQEKAMIATGNKELADLTENIKKKLGESIERVPSC